MKKHVDTESKRRRIRILLTVCSVVILAILTAVAAFAIYINANGIDTDIDIREFESAGNDTVTKLYCFSEGKAVELSGERLYGSQVTIFAPIESIPQNLRDAFVAIEDKRFYSHHGVDWYRTAGAGLNYFLKFRSGFGASTITQQLIKNVTGNDDYSINRKIQEIICAVDLESKMEKDEILELYLNIVNLSQGCYGVGAAAQRYFSKDVSELTLAECAAIAAITKNPSYYDPIRRPQNNAERRDVILLQMREQGYIGEGEFEEAYEKELVLNPNTEADGVNSWYTDMVVSDVIDDLVAELGYTEAAASYLVFSGGLKIYTAMDEKIQSIVDDYFSNTDNFPVDDLESGRCSMMIISPENGNILAVAGAVGEKTANRIQNYATDTVRPSGSCIKPLSVYAPALEEELITWSSVYDDVPVSFIENADGGYTTWPNNATLTYRGLTNIRCAVRNSLNTVSVRVLGELGNEKSFKYLTEKFNLDSLIPADRGTVALSLGQQSYGVTLREMTAAYTAFANDGICSKARSYLLVLDRDGNVLLSRDSESVQAISGENAAVVTKLLQNVTDAADSITLKEKIECAGKTGTTQNTCDRWFIGYTPYYIGGVWYGHEYPSTLPESTKTVCTRVWNEVMTKIHSDIIDSQEVIAFEIPEDVMQASFCVDSGKLMTGACLADPRGSRLETGWFVAGTQPTTYCECHTMVNYDVVNGGVVLGGGEGVEEVGLVLVERNFPTQIYVTDAQYAARALPTDFVPAFSEKLPYFASLLGENEYCGISETERQYNRLSIAHLGLSVKSSPKEPEKQE